MPDLIREVVAREVMPHFGKLSASEIETKDSPTDYVSKVDRNAEATISPGLRLILPHAKQVGEERVTALDGLKSLNEPGDVWVIDSLDGTKNYIEQQPGFTFMLALVRNSKPYGGWIFDPMRNNMLHGIVSEGAWFNGKPLLIKPKASLQEMSGRVNTSLFEPSLQQHLDAELARMQGKHTYVYAAGDSMLSVIDGRHDFAIFRDTAKAWDALPAAAIFNAAGGRMAYADGEDYYFASPRRGVPLLASPDRDQWNALANLLFPPAILAKAKAERQPDTKFMPM